MSAKSRLRVKNDLKSHFILPTFTRFSNLKMQSHPTLMQLYLIRPAFTCTFTLGTHLHVFPIRQTGRSIIVSGRNGAGFRKDPTALWWAVGLEVGLAECIYTWVGQRKREKVCLRLACFHRSAGGRSWTHPESWTEGWLCSGHSGLEGLGWV